VVPGPDEAPSSLGIRIGGLHNHCFVEFRKGDRFYIVKNLPDRPPRKRH
jgi:hypothetical protein